MRKLAIAMPIEGDPASARVHYSVQLLMRKIGGVIVGGEKVPAIRLDDAQFGPEIATPVDVVKARDRLARVALHDTDCTDVLWWDEDVLPDDLSVIPRMLETGFDVVGAPYRRKKDPEEYPYRLHGPDGGRVEVEIENDCVQVDGMAFGFMLTSRYALQRMWDYYHQERWYFDTYGGKTYETVSMFQLQYSPVETGPDGGAFRVQLSEDYSFCQSYRAIGGKVMMYVGPGTPVGHIGSHVYRGTREGLISV